MDMARRSSAISLLASAPKKILENSIGATHKMQQLL
jgi:hypothetical protein